MTKKPQILITLDTGVADRRGVPLATVVAKRAYGDAVAQAGGLPLFVAPTADDTVMDAFGDLMDGLVVTGGDFDIPPETYGATAGHRRLDTPKTDRTGFEHTLLHRALERKIPILGICGGMQLLNVVLGGTLLIDIAADRPQSLNHEQPTSPRGPDHDLVLTKDTEWAERLGPGPWAVNSTHHQAIDRVAASLRVWATATDGIIEAVEHVDDPAVVGVQWHPELLEDAISRRLYGNRVAVARERMV